jgi:hypothetical protein
VIAKEVAAYFSKPDCTLSQVSDDPRRQIDWPRGQGGPDRFVVPESMQGLPSYGRKVLSVWGQNVYQSCFLLDGITNGAVMPGKKAELMHLVVAPKAAFAAPPAQGQRTIRTLADGGYFTSWTDGDQTYVAAGMVPAERFEQLVHAL